MSDTITADVILATAETRMATAYGAGANAINWQQVLALLLNILSGCLSPTPTPPAPAFIKSQVQRPIVKMRLARKLMQHGYQHSAVPGIVNAAAVSVEGATDVELTSLVSAENESR